MAMRFFDHQASARKRSRRLVLAFSLATLATIAGLHIALAAPWLLTRWILKLPLGYPLGFMPINIGVGVALVMGGWWLEHSNMARGGVHLAERLGARRALPAVRFEEERLVNVVAEICAAAQMPQPTVMVLPRHPGINAFATGLAPSDWALTVTDGALDHLTRSELLGLVAHECSHLAEGDTRLNMNLLAMVAGLEMIWGFGRSLHPDPDGDDPLFSLGDVGRVVGTAIMAAGYAGWLGGRVLQAAVSREREFLADARAVQWTRQADGLGRVLRKLMTQQRQAGATSTEAPAHMQLAAHMLLVDDDGRWPLPEHRSGRAAWLATHPPLAERVRRIYGHPRKPLPLQRMDPRTGQPSASIRPNGATGP